MLYYKIRRKSDGKFSTGGMSPKFTNQGKLWTINHLKSHLALFKYNSGNKDNITHVYKNCEVIEYELKDNDQKLNPGQLHFEYLQFNEI